MDILSSVLGKLDTVSYSIICTILAIFAASFVTMLKVRGRYRKLSRDLSSLTGRKDSKCKYQILNNIINEYKTVSISSKAAVNTQAIIEKSFSTKLRGLRFGERLVKNSVSLMVILGLLGTFYGLTLSVGKLVELLSESSNTDMLTSMGSIILSLISAVRGMSAAFATSLAGIACSTVITVLGIVFNIEEARQALMVQIEEHLDNTVELELAKYKESEFSLMNKALVSSLKDIGNKMEDVMNSTVSDFAEKLAAASSSIETSSESLKDTIVKFDQALSSFRDNTRDFSEFNYNLRSNIERMDVSFSNLNEVLGETVKLISSDQRAMSEFSSVVQLVTAALSQEVPDEK